MECVFACQGVCRSGMCAVLMGCLISYDGRFDFVCLIIQHHDRCPAYSDGRYSVCGSNLPDS